MWGYLKVEEYNQPDTMEEEEIDEFSSFLPTHLKERIFCLLQDNELEKARRVCKEWKNFIDTSSHPQLMQVRENREEYFKDKEIMEYNSKRFNTVAKVTQN